MLTMTVSLLVAVGIGVGALAVGALVAGLIAYRAGINYRKRVAEAAIGSAEAEAERILKDARQQAESSKKEALVKAKDEIYRLRNESDKEIKERRADVQRQENRLHQKEESLDRKIENYEKKEEKLADRIKEVEARMADAEALKKSQYELLERLSGFTQEQAKEYLLNSLSQEFGNFNKEQLRAILESCGIDPGCRGETLTLEQFGTLADAFFQH